MQVGVVYAVYEMQCQHCATLWTASVDANFIEWFDGSVEINHDDDVECPKCGLTTSIEDGEPDSYED